MLKEKNVSGKNEGLNYMVDIDAGECIICFWTNAPKKITRLLLILWFANVRESGDYYTLYNLFEEFGYASKNYNQELEQYVHLDLSELTY
jgi:hypothetical protein